MGNLFEFEIIYNNSRNVEKYEKKMEKFQTLSKKLKSTIYRIGLVIFKKSRTNYVK